MNAASDAALVLVSVWAMLALGGAAERAGWRYAMPASFAVVPSSINGKLRPGTAGFRSSWRYGLRMVGDTALAVAIHLG